MSLFTLKICLLLWFLCVVIRLSCVLLYLSWSMIDVKFHEHLLLWRRRNTAESMISISGNFYWEIVRDNIKTLRKRKFEPLHCQDNWASADKDYVNALIQHQLRGSLGKLFCQIFAVWSAEIYMRENKEQYFPYRDTDSHPKDASSKQDKFHFELSCQRDFFELLDNIQCITWNST